MFFGTLLIGWALRSTGLSNFTILAVQVVGGATIYALAAFIVARPISMTLLRLVTLATRRSSLQPGAE